MRANNTNINNVNLKIRNKSPVNFSNNQTLNQQLKLNRLSDDNFLDRNKRDYSNSTERIYINTGFNNPLRTSDDNSFNKSPSNSVKSNYNYNYNKNIHNKTNNNFAKNTNTINNNKTNKNNNNNAGTTFNNYLNINPNKNNMNKTLANRNLTISKGKVTSNIKKPKNEVNISNNYINNNNQFKNYNNNNQQQNVSSAGVGISKSIEFKNENKPLGKLAGNNEQITISSDNVFRVTTMQNDLSLNTSDITQNRTEVKNYGHLSVTERKNIVSKTRIKNQSLNMNEIHKHEINSSSKFINNPSPNRFNNPTTLKKTNFINKPLNKERTNTPTNRETNRNLINNNNNNFSNNNNKLYNEKNKTLNNQLAGQNKKFHEKALALNATKKFKITNTDHIISEYKNTLKNNKFYINTEREDNHNINNKNNNNTLNPTYSKQKMNLINNKTLRENTNTNLKNNLSPDGILYVNKKNQFNETLKNKKELITKKILSNRNDLNNSFQHNNKRLYMNQTLKTSNFINNKSNELKAKNISKSVDRNDPQFNSNKLNQIKVNINNDNNNYNNYNNQVENRNNKSINNQQSNENNKQMNNDNNANLGIKQVNYSNAQKPNQSADTNSIGKNVFSLNSDYLNSKKTKGNESMTHDSMEIDERLKEIKMSQLNESKFPPENLILNPLKDKENQNIFNDINNFLDKNEKQIKNKSAKNLIENPNFSSKQLTNAKYLITDLNHTKVNNFNNTSQHNVLANKDVLANLMLNNSIIENNNLNNSAFLNTNKNSNFKNPSSNQAADEIKTANRLNKNSLSMIENNFVNPNDLSINLDLNNNKKNFNNNTFSNNNNNPQSLNNSIYIIKDGKLYNNNNNNALNKSVVSVNDEMNKSLIDKNTHANNFLELTNINKNYLKNKFYQSVGNKTENDLNCEKLILDKINLEIVKSETRLNQETAKLKNNTNLKKEEEIYLKSEVKKLNNKIDILKKEKEQQERLVKQAEAKLILKFELELKERLKNDRNAKFNNLTNNQLNNSMFNNLNFHSTSNCNYNNNNNTNNNLQINNLNLSIHATPGKIEKYNKLININNSAENFLNKQNPKLNEKLLITSNNIEINLTNNNKSNKNAATLNLKEENRNKFINPEAILLEELKYENEEKERLMHFENLEKEMLLEKQNKKNNDLEKLEKEKQERDQLEKQKLFEKQQKERLESEKKEAERLEKIRLENEKIEKENKEKALKEKIENEKIAELMKKLEEEKLQRILFEEKIKKLEADKKQKENSQNPLEPHNSAALNDLHEIENKILKNSEIINELNNSLSNSNRNGGNLTHNLVNKNGFKFDLLDSKSNLNKNSTANKYSEMNFNNTSANNSILNDSKDKLKTLIDNSNKDLGNVVTNISFFKNNNIAERKPSIYNNLNNNNNNNLRQRSNDSRDQPRKYSDDVRLAKTLFENSNNTYNNKEPINIRRLTDPAISQNIIPNNVALNNSNNADVSSVVKTKMNESLMDENNYNNNNNSILNRNEEKENRRISSLNSSILSEKDKTTKEKYNFKSFIFANKSGDSVEKANNNNNNNNKNIINFDLKTKLENKNISVFNEEKQSKNIHTVIKENAEVSDKTKSNSDYNKILLSNLNEVKDSPKKSISPEKKGSTSELNTPDNSCFVNPKLDDKYIVVNVDESDDEDELDDQKFQLYQDYVNKMKDMASETKDIENNMRQFTNIIKNIVSSNSAQVQNA